MVVGEKRRFWIPEELAYNGRPGAPAGHARVRRRAARHRRAPPIRRPTTWPRRPTDAKKTQVGPRLQGAQAKGTGKDTARRRTSSVEVHYSGWTTDGKMFDSSVTRGEPATFPLNGVIAGWTEGVQLMVVGEKTPLLDPRGARLHRASRGAPAGHAGLRRRAARHRSPTASAAPPRLAASLQHQRRARPTSRRIVPRRGLGGARARRGGGRASRVLRRVGFRALPSATACDRRRRVARGIGARPHDRGLRGSGSRAGRRHGLESLRARRCTHLRLFAGSGCGRTRCSARTRMVHITDYEGFHERDYYAPGDHGAPVYETSVGRDRQSRSATTGTSPSTCARWRWRARSWWSCRRRCRRRMARRALYEAEMRVAAFRTATSSRSAIELVRRTCSTFAGESFVVRSGWTRRGRAAPGVDETLYADVDLADAERSHARTLVPGVIGGRSSTRSWFDRRRRLDRRAPRLTRCVSVAACARLFAPRGPWVRSCRGRRRARWIAHRPRRRCAREARILTHRLHRARDASGAARPAASRQWTWVSGSAHLAAIWRAPSSRPRISPSSPIRASMCTRLRSALVRCLARREFAARRLHDHATVGKELCGFRRP